MISKESFVKSLIDYAEKEIITVLPQWKKVAAGAFVILANDKINSIATDLMGSSLLQSLCVVKDNQIDNEKLITALRESCTKYGKIDVEIPLIGNLKFSTDDIDKLGTYMRGGTYGREITNSSDGVS